MVSKAKVVKGGKDWRKGLTPIMAGKSGGLFQCAAKTGVCERKLNLRERGGAWVA